MANESGATGMMETLGAIKMYASFVLEVIILTLHLLWAGPKRIMNLINPPAPRPLNNEIILVTGGSNGIGRELLIQFAQLDSRLTLISWDVDSERNASTVRELQALGVSKAYAFEVDITDNEQVSTAAARIRNEIGDVTMLFNNAGIAGKLGAIWETDPSAVEKIFNVNAISHVATLREFLPAMIRKNQGNVVATCSVLGFLWGKHGFSYVASKHAVRATMECLKEELRDIKVDNVKVSIVYPSLTFTDILTGINLHPEKYPFLVQGMKPSYVAKKIIHGVLTAEEHIYVPRSGRYAHMFVSLLPSEVLRKMYDVLSIGPASPPRKSCKGSA